MREVESRRVRLLLAVIVCLAHIPPVLAEAPPSPSREFRGVWVASVSNMDWPSRKGLSAAQQQAELRAILDQAAGLKFNVVIFQVRPMADALYASKLEPWSEYLTGTAGKAPDPYYDPLEYAVRAAHERGLQLHAWFNPFRARHSSATSPIPADHIIRRRPELAKRYGTEYWLNPTHREVQKHSLAVILDVVRRYDIDGVHIDDYFYPYPEKDKAGHLIPFPDDDTWAAYQRSRGKLSRDNWRRAAINDFVEQMYHEVKAAKPWVRVGISPFGIWRPGYPHGISGLDAYQAIDADSRTWLRQGWCDYFAPQLYWPIQQRKQSYARLLDWWVSENVKGRHLCPGNFTSRVTGMANGWPAREIAEQIRLTRAQPGACGNIQFSMRALLRNTGGVADAVRGAYTEPALVPSMPWLKLAAPARPSAQWGDGKRETVLTVGPTGSGVRLYVVRYRQRGRWRVRVEPVHGTEQQLRFPDRPEQVVISAVDRAGNESAKLALAAPVKRKKIQS